MIAKRGQDNGLGLCDELVMCVCGEGVVEISVKVERCVLRWRGILLEI